MTHTLIDHLVLTAGCTTAAAEAAATAALLVLIARAGAGAGAGEILHCVLFEVVHFGREGGVFGG